MSSVWLPKASAPPDAIGREIAGLTSGLDELWNRHELHKSQVTKKAHRSGADSKVERSAFPTTTYRGAGPTTTGQFSARAPWRIAWNGRDVFFFLKRADGRLVRGDGGSGSGTVVVNETGRFLFDVVARGRWTITVSSG